MSGFGDGSGLMGATTGAPAERVAGVGGGYGTIRKGPGDGRLPPNLTAEGYTSFSWEQARSWLEGLPAGGLNIAHEAVDRHAAGPQAQRVALRWLGRGGEREDVTYGALRARTNRFAHVLERLGTRPGDAVYALLGRVPALYVAALGTLKAGRVFCPLFAAFGPEPVRQRLAIGEGRVLITTRTAYERKIAGMRDQLPSLEHVLLADVAPDDVPPQGTQSLAALLMDAPEDYAIGPTDPESPALLHFTSGTTGAPKGAVHVHDAVVMHHATGRFALDLHDEDVYWCTADPGWVTGTSYGIVAPLTVGVTIIVDEAEFEAARWYRILREERVSVWYTAPTAIRRLMRLGGPVDREGLALRFVASVGEPLNPEAVMWGLEAFGLPIHDNWWQTETGGIMIANTAAADIKPGSMGRPLPGVTAAVLRRGPDGVLLRDGRAEEAGDGAPGELALRPGWPSMFRGYLNAQERYARCFVGGWYLTGDLVTRDADGYFWFLGRSDDVIKSSGHLIGPFEVESTLMEHPAVAEAGVIGKPDPVAGEIVKAFVVLRPGTAADGDLVRELIGFGRSRLGAAVAPRQIDIVTELPHTRSGKIMRRLLRAREVGLPVGDLSALEEEGTS
jgi:acetyl-CoA synthetase